MLKSFGSSQAMSEYIDTKIEGSFLPADIDFLGGYVSELKPGDIYMEIGTSFGKSIASAIWQAKEDVKFYTCDLFDKPAEKEGKMSRKEFFEFEGLDEVCTFIKGDSLKIAKKWDKRLDMIFIDGEHTYQAVKTDMAAWGYILKPGGYIVFHDYNDPQFGVKQAVDKFVSVSARFDGFVTAHEVGLLTSSMAGAIKV